MKAKLISTLVLTASFLAAGAAGAEPARRAPPTLAVGYGDLKLDREADVRRLLARLAEAADDVCPYDQLEPAGWARQDCRREAIDQAVRKINADRLTAEHARRTRLAGR